MTAPAPDEIRRTIERTLELWNDHSDKEAWLQAYESLAPAGMSFEDPVGTAAKHGREALAPLWDGAAGVTITLEHLLICGSEAAALMRNEGTVNGHAFSVHTIETSTYGADGTLHVRVFTPH